MQKNDIEKKTNQYKYIFFTVFAGVLWGIISIFLKGLNKAGISSVEIVAIRAIISSAILFFYFLIKDKRLLKIQFKDIWMFIGTGVLSLTFFSLCYFKTILECGVSVAVILLYTSPIFILLFSLFLFNEKLNLKKIIALVLTFLGCILISGLSGESKVTMKGFLIGLGSGLGYGLYSIFSRYALKKYSSLTVTFYTFVFSGISLIPVINFSKVFEIMNFEILFFMLGISIFCTVLPYIFYTFGLSGLETGAAAIFVTIEPLVATLIGFILYKEELTVTKICGIVFIFAAVILLSAKSRRRTSIDNRDTNK